MPHAYEPLEPDPVIEAYKRDVDRAALRENLKLSVEERITKLMLRVEQAERDARRDTKGGE